MNKLNAAEPSYADLESRLQEMEAVVAALRDHQVDAIVGENDVALVHLWQVEEALRESGERYQAFVRNSSEGIWRYEMDPPMAVSLDEEQQVDYILSAGVVAECNDAMARLAGYKSASDMIGHKGFLDAPDLPYREALLKFVRLGYRVSDFEAPATDVDGNRRWLAMTFVGMPKQGKLGRIWGVQRDITERRRAEEHLRQRTSELSALLSITRDVANTLELQPLLDNLLTQLRSVLEYSGAVVVMLDGDNLEIVAYDGALPSELMLTSKAPAKALAPLRELMETRRPVILDAAPAEQVIDSAVLSAVGAGSLSTLTRPRSWLFAPLVVKGRMIGLLSLRHEAPGRFSERHAELAQAFADHAAVAIENARLYREAQQLAAVNERQKLAAELHDSVSQAIYSISLAAHTGLANLDQRPERVRNVLNHILGLSEAAFIDIRSLIFELRPESLARHGLVSAIERQAEILRSRERSQIHLDLGREPDAPIEAKEAVYRIAQESMNNIVKHARAKTVWVRLATENGELCLEVRDDGKGFDPNHDYAGHLGLRVMRERAERFGGSVTIDSVPRGGTTVQARLPLKSA